MPLLTRQSDIGWIGLDLGARAVKLAQVVRSGNGYRLAAARVIARQTSESEDDDGLWWATLLGKPSRSGFEGRSAACVLSAAATDLRGLNLPDADESERRAMVAGELENWFADGDSRVFDFWQTRSDEAQSNLENIAVLSLAEDTAMAVAESVDFAGFRCQAIDGLPTAMARAVDMVNPGGLSVPVAAVDWGFQTATFTVVHQGRAVFTRQLRDCQFGRLPSATSQMLGLSVEDSERLLNLHGVADPSRRDEAAGEVQEVLGDVLSEPMAAMVAELDRTLAYPELHRSQLAPQALWLFGGGATVRNIAPYLESRIGVPVHVWRLPGQGNPSVAPLLGPAAAVSTLAWMQ